MQPASDYNLVKFYENAGTYFVPICLLTFSWQVSPSSITKEISKWAPTFCAISSKNKIEGLWCPETNRDKCAGFIPTFSANSVRESPNTSLNSVILAAISFRVKSKSKSFS